MRTVLLRSLLTLAVLIFLLYKPLPKGLCSTSRDRFLMHLFESSLRVTYFYPTRLMTRVTPMVMWTRAVLTNLTPFLGLRHFFTPYTARIKDELWAGVPVRLYSPTRGNNSNGGIIFIHGGGFALGNVAMYDSMANKMVDKLNTMIVSIEYRLSPETPFPGGLHDCENVIDYFFSIAKERFDVDTSKIVIAGDSAGGGLATVIAQRRKLRGVQQLAGQVLMYPLLQMADLQSASYRNHQQTLEGYALVDPESVVLYYMFYAGFDMDTQRHLAQIVLTNGHVSSHQRKKVEMILDYDEDNEPPGMYPPRVAIQEDEEVQKMLEPWIFNPDFSPMMREDLRGLPPAYIMTVEYDVLRDEGQAYAKRLQKQGVDVTYRHFKHGFHAFINFHVEIEEADKALEDMIHWIRKTIVY